MDFDYQIEKEYKLEKLQSQRGKNIIIQNKDIYFIIYILIKQIIIKYIDVHITKIKNILVRHI